MSTTSYFFFRICISSGPLKIEKKTPGIVKEKLRKNYKEHIKERGKQNTLKELNANLFNI